MKPAHALKLACRIALGVFIFPFYMVGFLAGAVLNFINSGFEDGGAI